MVLPVVGTKKPSFVRFFAVRSVSFWKKKEIPPGTMTLILKGLCAGIVWCYCVAAVFTVQCVRFQNTCVDYLRWQLAISLRFCSDESKMRAVWGQDTSKLPLCWHPPPPPHPSPSMCKTYVPLPMNKTLCRLVMVARVVPEVLGLRILAWTFYSC